jgi:hypothetical protein
MLPPFIIEQIRRREDEERRRVRDEQQRPRLEIPKPSPSRPGRPADGPGRRQIASDEDEDDADRGVIILDLGG